MCCRYVTQENDFSSEAFTDSCSSACGQVRPTQSKTDQFSPAVRSESSAGIGAKSQEGVLLFFFFSFF